MLSSVLITGAVRLLHCILFTLQQAMSLVVTKKWRCIVHGVVTIISTFMVRPYSITATRHDTNACSCARSRFVGCLLGEKSLITVQPHLIFLLNFLVASDVAKMYGVPYYGEGNGEACCICTWVYGVS